MKSGDPIYTSSSSIDLPYSHSEVTDSVVDEVGVLAETDNPLVAMEIHVLIDIGAGGLRCFHDLVYGQLLLLEQAEDFEANGMGMNLSSRARSSIL